MIARLDGIATDLGKRTTRRSVLSGIAAGIAGLTMAAPADAARTKRAVKGKRKTDRSNTCPASRQCGTTCCTGKARCADANLGICSRPGEMIGS